MTKYCPGCKMPMKEPWSFCSCGWGRTGKLTLADIHPSCHLRPCIHGNPLAHCPKCVSDPIGDATSPDAKCACGTHSRDLRPEWRFVDVSTGKFVCGKCAGDRLLRPVEPTERDDIRKGSGDTTAREAELLCEIGRLSVENGKLKMALKRSGRDAAA